MRKKQKESFHEIIYSLLQINAHFAGLISDNKMNVIPSIIEECQQSAIAIGNKIDELEGEGTKTVKFLEDYCELLYKFCMVIMDGNADSANKHSNSKEKYQTLLKGYICQLGRLLEQINTSIDEDITENPKEIVFLPYKASMWDSLESVWRDAENDHNCNAVVIPIPYYDKNPDGSFGTMHYEGDQYPEYVTITKYDQYDFESHHPDMIYIHNPYDAGNFVTSILPFFYSSNLKQYTDDLVYIPYYVLAEPNLDNEDYVKWLTPFVMTAGVINSDHVIVQSEDMRKAYIKILTGQYPEVPSKLWEKKISGSGSPKIDKIIKAGNDDWIIPEEWEKKIVRSDGSRKKIILYNNGVSTMLKFSSTINKKIESVLKIFKNHKDEIVLLWRPHPLIMATINSMRPELLDGYSEIVRRYREENWGIYDESSDIDRAVSICSAYYGDLSSVVQLCQRMGKYVMIENPTMFYQ